MQVGDLVKVKGMPSSDYGIITKTYVKGGRKIEHRWWSVYFVSLEYEVPFMEEELETINEKGS